MTKLRTSKPMLRREALKGLGALAVSAPSFGTLGCGAGERAAGSAQNAAGSEAAAAAPASGSAAGTHAVAGTPGANVSTSPGAGGASTATGAGTSGVGATKSAEVAGVQATGAGTRSGVGGVAAVGGSSGSSGVAAASGGHTAAGSSAGSAGVAADGGSGTFMPVSFDSVASCTLTPTDPAGEGPFFIHEDEVMNDAGLMRSDMREGKPGVELQLNLRVLDSDGKCMTPIAGVEVYTWHTDASGLYSGFNGQNPDQSYMGAIERTVENMERFCRGIQVTDSQGIVRFKTVYPGWYNGRAIHIHFVALRPGSGPDTTNYRGNKYMVFTTQMYFAEQFSRMIHENNTPYKARASGSAYSKYVKPQNTTVNPSVRMEGNIAIGALNIITAAMGSRR